jgi:hypothetical protein
MPHPRKRKERSERTNKQKHRKTNKGPKDNTKGAIVDQN